MGLGIFLQFRFAASNSSPTAGIRPTTAAGTAERTESRTATAA